MTVNFGKIKSRIQAYKILKYKLKIIIYRMNYEEFLEIFDVLYLCHLSADCFLDELFKKNKVFFI